MGSQDLPDSCLVLASRRVPRPLGRTPVQDQRQRGLRLRRVPALAGVGEVAQVHLERGGAGGHAALLERRPDAGAGDPERNREEERVEQIEELVELRSCQPGYD